MRSVISQFEFKKVQGKSVNSKYKYQMKIRKEISTSSLYIVSLRCIFSLLWHNLQVESFNFKHNQQVLRMIIKFKNSLLEAWKRRLKLSEKQNWGNFKQKIRNWFSDISATVFMLQRSYGNWKCICSILYGQYFINDIQNEMNFRYSRFSLR